MPVNTSLASRITRAVRKRNSSSNDTLSLRWFSHKKETQKALLSQTSPPGTMPGHTPELHPHGAVWVYLLCIPQASWILRRSLFEHRRLPPHLQYHESPTVRKKCAENAIPVFSPGFPSFQNRHVHETPFPLL